MEKRRFNVIWTNTFQDITFSELRITFIKYIYTVGLSKTLCQKNMDAEIQLPLFENHLVLQGLNTKTETEKIYYASLLCITIVYCIPSDATIYVHPFPLKILRIEMITHTGQGILVFAVRIKTQIYGTCKKLLGYCFSLSVKYGLKMI